ncbi:MAG: hypothetical protein LN416_01765 [Candidatus Thermoplasmatota archaeon]|nr:hypothetical protein [Candidatus Thermoplasmatota archaeon]
MDEDMRLGTCADCDGKVRKKPLYCESSDTCRRKLKGEGRCSECDQGTFHCIPCQLRERKAGKFRIPRTRQDDFQKRARGQRLTFQCTKCLLRCALRFTWKGEELDQKACPFGREASWFPARGRGG